MHRLFFLRLKAETGYFSVIWDYWEQICSRFFFGFRIQNLNLFVQSDIEQDFFLPFGTESINWWFCFKMDTLYRIPSVSRRKHSVSHLCVNKGTEKLKVERGHLWPDQKSSFSSYKNDKLSKPLSLSLLSGRKSRNLIHC